MDIIPPGLHSDSQTIVGHEESRKKACPLVITGLIFKGIYRKLTGFFVNRVFFPSGKLTQLWKITIFLVGKSTISMAMFNSYFDITRGYIKNGPRLFLLVCWFQGIREIPLLFQWSNTDMEHHGTVVDHSNQGFKDSPTSLSYEYINLQYNIIYIYII